MQPQKRESAKPGSADHARDALPGMLEPCLVNGWIKKGGTWHKVRDLMEAGFTAAEARAMHEGDATDP